MSSSERKRLTPALLLSGGSWTDATIRWAQNALLPIEKVIAVLAMGQILRVGADMTGLWAILRDMLPKPSSLFTAWSSLSSSSLHNNPHTENPQSVYAPVSFFRVTNHKNNSDQGYTLKAYSSAKKLYDHVQNVKLQHS